MNHSHYNKALKEFARENRNDSTFGEILLWKKLLSKGKTGYQFNRQFPIDDYIVDFISRKLKLVIEVDGTYHKDIYEKDIERDKQLNAIGYTVLRFSERDVRFNFDNVSRAILIWISDYEKSRGTNPPNPLRQGGRIHLEIACFSAADAIIAQNAGADRIELCENYSLGGITPSQETIEHARKKLQIPLFVMIRPREANFIYDAAEFDKMKEQILLCKRLNCEGVVFGILDKKNNVDKVRCKELVELARPMYCTFHRAFDEVQNMFEALEDVIDCGFTRILTSGQKNSAYEGIENINLLIKKANDRISIMPGGGVRSSNISEIIAATDATEIHSAAMNKTTNKIDPKEIKEMKLICAQFT